MKKLLALILAMVMCFSLVACGGDKQDDAGKPAESGKPAETKPIGNGESNAPVGNTAPPEAEVEYKKEVVWTEANAAFEEPDPQANSALQNTKQHLLTHDRLVYLNPETNEVEPMLATKWDISDDGLTYTFYLRDDVYFHNGEKMTSDDVIYTVERGRLSANSTIKAQYTSATYTAVDEYTVKCTLETGNADFLSQCSKSYMAIVNREACEADELEGSWIGTGLWIMDEFYGQDGATWVRNDNYWGESTPTERLTMRHIPEAATRLIGVETGELDYARNIPTLSVEDVEANEDLQCIGTVSTMCTYIGFNNEAEGPWNDLNFRKAMAYAIDYDGVIQAIYSGRAEQAVTFWGYSDMFGYAPPADGYSYDPELAKEYLAKTDYDGEAIELLCYGASWGKVGVIVQDMFAKVGINITVNEAESAAYSPAVKADEYQMNCYTYSFPVFGSGINNFATGNTGQNCLAGVPHYDEIMKLLADGMTTTDSAARKEIYAELQELWMEDLVTIPIYHPHTFGAADKNFEGTIFVGSGEHDFRYVRVPLD